MKSSNGKRPRIFGPFRFDPQSRELLKFGVRLRLEDQPALVLACLLNRAGEVVSREELQKQLWPDGVHVDFEHGLNKTINKLRFVLGDDPSQPKYVETLPRIGYRFVSPVEVANGPVAPLTLAAVTNESALPSAGDRVIEFVATVSPISVIGVSRAEAMSASERIANDEQPIVSFLQRHRRPVSAVMVLASVVLLVAMLMPSAYAPPSRTQAVRAFIAPAAGTRLIASGDHAGLALSPDGTRVVFSAIGPNGRTMLWLRRMDAMAPEPLTGTEEGSFPFWSADGSSLGFFTDLTLKRLTLATGEIAEVCAASSGRGGSWSNDTILFAHDTRSPIYRVPAAGGTPVPVTRLDGTNSTTHRWPEFLPDGKHFVFFAANHDIASAPGTIYVGSLDGTPPSKLMEADSNAKPVAGSLLFVSGGKLLSQQLNIERRRLDSLATIVTTDVDYDRGLWHANFAVSTNALVYRPRSDLDHGQVIAMFDTQGNRMRDISYPGPYFTVNLAPDGHAVAGGCGDPDRNICLVHLDGTITHMTNSPISSGVIWSPDSTTIAYDAHRDPSRFRIVLKPLAEGAPEREVLSAEEGLHPFSWHPDRGHLLVGRDVKGKCCELFVFNLRSHRQRPYLPVTTGLFLARFSPDGHWVAYQSDEAGATEVYVTSYPTPSTRYRVTKSGGSSPRWRTDGSELYFLGPGQTITAVGISSKGTSLVFGQPRSLFSPPILAPPFDRDSFDVDATGKNFVVNTVGVGDTAPLVLVSKWNN